MKKNNTYKKVPIRKKRLEARVSEEEYAKASSIAEQCDLSMSDYIRSVALGHHPRFRLTPDEISAFNNIADARGDLMRIATTIRGIEATERGKYFRNTRFVTEWMNAAKPLIDRLTEILEHSTDE